MSITGAPVGQPQKVGVAVTDIFTGMYAATAILAALRMRDQTGEGQHIDLGLLDVAVAITANQAMNYLTTGGSAAADWQRTSEPGRHIRYLIVLMAGSSSPQATMHSTNDYARCSGMLRWRPIPIT